MRKARRALLIGLQNTFNYRNQYRCRINHNHKLAWINNFISRLDSLTFHSHEQQHSKWMENSLPAFNKAKHSISIHRFWSFQSVPRAHEFIHVLSASWSKTFVDIFQSNLFPLSSGEKLSFCPISLPQQLLSLRQRARDLHKRFHPPHFYSIIFLHVRLLFVLSCLVRWVLKLP